MPCKVIVTTKDGSTVEFVYDVDDVVGAATKYQRDTNTEGVRQDAQQIVFQIIPE